VDGLRGGGIHAIVGVTGTDQPDRVSPIRIKEITMINDLFDFIVAAVQYVLNGIAVAPGALSSIVIG
jgi:hypothetical protein